MSRICPTLLNTCKAVALTLVVLVGSSNCASEPLRSEDKPSAAEKLAVSKSALTATGPYVTSTPDAQSFMLFAAGSAANLAVGSEDFAGVIRAAGDLQQDIERVSGIEPSLSVGPVPEAANVILIGTVGQSPLIDDLVSSGKLDVSALEGRWESFIIETVDEPMAGVDRGLVIAGSDKRGTIYGIYDLSESIGVSPWHFFADVPPRQQTDLFVAAGRHTRGEPAVKYRGFFINDEHPALLDWYNETYDGNGRFDSRFYTQVFELLLRMKGNYLWPAMWGKSFNVDDVDNPRLADEYGVVMGTSHHEPMTRSEQEWYDNGNTQEDWNYETNGAALREFWRGGIERMGDRETLITVAMRGSGDLPPPSDNIELMEGLVADQREIIADVTGRDASTVPQVWALYKEIQTLYDSGMQVPDDVTLLFADDNWGNIRRLPNSSETRPGGYGVYYHFDYVGGPRSYKWLNTNPIPRVWEQMRLAHGLGATQVWIVNVGDIKPMEFPLQFFLDYAWNPDSWTAQRMNDYPKQWASAQFGEEHAEAIGAILKAYTKFNGRRKPELLEPGTYSLINFHEAERVVEDYNALVEEAERIDAALATDARDAFYQLVLYPVQACANLNELYYTVAKNRLYAAQGRATANELAVRAAELFERDEALATRYHELAGGKWNHMMKQTHIGYVDWQEPASNVMPDTSQVQLAAQPTMGVAIEGSSDAWPTTAEAILPALNPFEPEATRTIEVFNRGSGSFEYTATTEAAYVSVSPAAGSVEGETRLLVSVDWSSVPYGRSSVPITISDGNASVTVQAVLDNPEAPRPEDVVGFVETNGYVSIEAEQYTAKVDGDGALWERVPGLGRTLSAMAASPPSAPAQTPGETSPHLEYALNLFSTGTITVRTYLSPTLPIHGVGLRYAVSLDESEPQTANMHSSLPADFTEATPEWEEWVKNNIITVTTTHTVDSAGPHVLKVWMVDANVVLQKIVVEFGEVPSSYLGPPSLGPLNFEPLEPPDSGNGGAGNPDDAAGGGGGGNEPDGPDGPLTPTTPVPEPTAPPGTASTPAPAGPGTVVPGPSGSNAPPSGAGGFPSSAPMGTGGGSVGEVLDADGADDGGGCGCRLMGESARGTSHLAWLGALAALGVRRRRSPRGMNSAC